MADSSVSYLTQAFALTRERRTAELLSLRRSFLRAAGRLTSDPDEVVGKRQARSGPPNLDRAAAREALENIQEQFWFLSHDETRTRLKAIDLTSYPELKEHAAKLLRVSALRDTLDELTFDETHTRTMSEFVELFRRIIVAPMREAAEYKNRFEAIMLGDLGVWREPGIEDFPVSREASLRHAKHIAHRLLKVYPSLAALEEEWLRSVTQLRNWRKEEVASVGGATTFLIWLVLWILFRLVGC